MISGKKAEAAQPQKGDVSINQPLPTSPEAMAAFQKQQQDQLDREKKIQQQRQIYAERKQQEEEQEISGCVYFNGQYTAIDEYARYIPEKSHLCKQVIREADRRAMKKPTKQVYNNYSQDASAELETARTVEAQREYFNEP